MAWWDDERWAGARDERWPDRGDESRERRRADDWRRPENWRGGDWRWPGATEMRHGGPFRRGGDYGAREWGAEDFERWHGADPGGRGEGWTDRGRGTRAERREGGWGSGDYTTYGQSGYREPGRGMRRDLEREQGRYGVGQRPEPRRGRGPKGWRRSDERIHEEVCERIARSGVDADEVEVRVEHGEVTLSGTTETRADKRMLEDLAADVLGVDDVHNQVRVDRSARVAGGSEDGGPGRPERTH